MKINKTIKKLLLTVVISSITTTSFAFTVQANAQTIEETSNQTTQVIAEVQTSESSINNTKDFILNNREFLISDRKEFSVFMTTPLFWSKAYKVTLERDIDMLNETFETINEFSGVFDGCGHTIYNLKVGSSKKNKNDVTLIKTLNSSAEIKNVTFDNYNIECNFESVGLIATNHGNISNVNLKNVTIKCFSKEREDIVDSDTVGFLYSNEEDGIIENCSVQNIIIKSKYIYESSLQIIQSGFLYKNNGKITNSSTTLSVDCRLGGFVGENSGTIEECRSKGKVISYCCSGYAGGFCGKNLGCIKSCTSECSVEAKHVYKIMCGGFVGKNEKGEISDCTSTGNATGQDYVGGFVGVNKSNITNCHAYGKATAKTQTNTALAGGFVGENEEGTINKCIATGGADSRSTSGQAKAGGFAGINKANITDSSVNTKKNVKVYLSSGIFYKDNGCGGFVGKNDKGGSIKNCYATTNVETTNHKKGGGFVGEAKNNSEICDSRCDTNKILKNGETEKAKFCQDNDKKAVIKNCYNFIIIKLDF